MVFRFLKVIVFLLSSMGMWELFRRRTKINPVFIPSLAVALQTAMLFLAGVVRILPGMAFFLWLLGLILFLGCCIKDKSLSFLKHYMTGAFAFLLVAMLAAFLSLMDREFTHYDNFSHWALVVKNILIRNRFPNGTDSMIQFQSYPLGSAVYIYFFSKLLGSAESVQMLAQVYMLTVCIMPVFVYEGKNKAASFLLVLGFTNLFFFYNILITDLLVDSLLPIVSMCALLFVKEYCLAWKDAIGMNGLLASVYLVQITQIKNSGVFFVVLIVVLLAVSKKSEMVGNKKRCIRFASVWGGVPILSIVLWKIHCALVYPLSHDSKHAMSLINYLRQLHRKDFSEIRQICVSMVRFVFTYKDILMLCLLLIMEGLLIWLLAGEFKASWKKVFVFSAGVYVCYQIGTLLMYLLSMPVTEALTLAGAGRYTKSIILAILYLVLCLAVKVIANTSRVRAWVFFVLTEAMLLFFSYSSTGGLFYSSELGGDSTKRDWIEKMRTEYQISDGESYCLLQSEYDYGFLYYMCKYVFQSDDVTFIVVGEESDLENADARYILIEGSDNEIIQNWVTQQYPDQYGNEVIIPQANP